MKLNKIELEQINTNLNPLLTGFYTKKEILEELKEVGLDGKSISDETKIYNEVYNNLTSVFFVDEIGQIWKEIENGEFMYIAKIKL